MYLAVAGDPLSKKEDTLSSMSKAGGAPTFSTEVLEAAFLLDSSSSSSPENESSTSSSSQLFSEFHKFSTCVKCKQKMFLICQAFCPFSENETQQEQEKQENKEKEETPDYDNINRMIYVVGCNSEECTRLNPDKAFSAIVVQIDKPDADADRHDNADVRNNNNNNNNNNSDMIKSPSSVASSSAAQSNNSTCSANSSDWLNNVSSKKKIWHSRIFPPLDLEIEEEEEDEDEDNYPEHGEEEKKEETAAAAAGISSFSNQQNLKFLTATKSEDSEEKEKKKHAEEVQKAQEIQKQLQEQGIKMSEEELQGLDLKDKLVDEMHSHFVHTIEKCPRQVLRFCPGGKPLFQNPTHEAVKKFTSQNYSCEHCHAKLEMELQVMPTVIFLLKCSQFVNTEKTSKTNDDGMDFGTLTVFSCPNQCDAKIKGCFVKQMKLLVEPAPSLKDEEAAAKSHGKTTFREVALGGDEEKN